MVTLGPVVTTGSSGNFSRLCEAKMNQTEEFSIGALSEHSDVNVETIRYYEKIGIMPAPARSANGYRIYGAKHARRLHFVRRGRGLGFIPDALRDLLWLVDRHPSTSRESQSLPVRHFPDIPPKDSDLRRP